MTARLDWGVAEETLSLTGELTQETLNPLWRARDGVIRNIKRIDLSQVLRVDTSGLALLIHLIALAKKRGNTVILDGVSEKALTLARLYNLPQDVLPHSLAAKDLRPGTLPV